jgi:lipid II:glycine glycyltransferase (peptidoglycan interpeptide bridge formation enzyme)
VLKLEPNVLNFEPSTLNLQPSTTIQPRTTIHVDLTRDLDAILAQMKQKWRYNIRLAERKGVIVRAGSADDIATFYRLLQITSKRDRFAIHSFEYYRAAFDLLTARDAARLFIAEYAREPLAAILVTAFGEEAIYLYGASSDAHRARMPNYALHWAAMQWAKARECARYDLWGIADVAWAEVDTVVGAKHSQDRDDKEGALPDRTGRQSGHGLADASPLPHGLYRFKQGFGGAVVRYAGAYDAVFSRARYWLYTRALALRRGAMT